MTSPHHASPLDKRIQVLAYVLGVAHLVFGATKLTAVAPFYDALDQPASKDVAALVESIASPEWRSYSGEAASKGRDEFINQVRGFGKLIPDLAWSIKDVIGDGDRVICAAKRAAPPPATSWASLTPASASPS